MCAIIPDIGRELRGAFAPHVFALMVLPFTRRDSGLESRLRSYFGNDITAAHLKMAEAPQGSPHGPRQVNGTTIHTQSPDAMLLSGYHMAGVNAIGPVMSVIFHSIQHRVGFACPYDDFSSLS